MRSLTFIVPLSLVSLLASTSHAGYVPAASATDLEDWRDMAGLPGGIDPSGNLYSGYTGMAGWHTSERIETFAGLATASNGTTSNWWKWSASSSGGSVGFGTGFGPAPSSDDPDRSYIYAMPSGSSLTFSFDGATIPPPEGLSLIHI